MIGRLKSLKTLASKAGGLRPGPTLRGLGRIGRRSGEALTAQVHRADRRMSIGHKLAAICLAFSIPLAVTTFFLVREQSFKIDFAQKEQFGVQYLTPLSGLLEDVSYHKSLNRRSIEGDPGVRAEMEEVAARIDQNFEHLLRLDNEVGVVLGTSKEDLATYDREKGFPSELASQWSKVKTGAGSSYSNEVLHDALLEGLGALKAQVGDFSKISLDPDIDTYYLGVVLLDREPLIVQSLNRLSDDAETLLDENLINFHNRVGFAEKVALLRDESSGLLNDLIVSFNGAAENSGSTELEATLNPMMRQTYLDLTETADLITRELVEAETVDLDPTAVVDTVRRAADSASSLQKEGLKQEYAMLETRRSGLLTGQRIALGAVFLSLALSIGLVIFLARGIARNLGTVARAAEGLSAGDLSQRAAVDTRDEIGVLAKSFNAMAERLETMVSSERKIKESLERSVQEYAEFVGRVASGDLTVRLTSAHNGNGSATNGRGDDLSMLTEHLNSMVTGLGQMSGRVRTGAQELSKAAGEILATVSQHTANASDQSAAITETSITVEEIRAAAEHAAGKAQDVADKAMGSVEAGNKGLKVVEVIVAGMADIKSQVEAIAQNILVLSDQTRQIGEITGMVNDLADQSNLLALNAAIEAARAGEHGRGFAVVAAEVRNLSEQSKAATAQVRAILTDVQKATQAAVLATEEGTKVVDSSLARAADAGGVIGELTEAIRAAAGSAQQILLTAQQQSLGMEQIAQAMSEIDTKTSEFAAGAEQSRTAAEGLDSLASELEALTSAYTTDD